MHAWHISLARTPAAKLSFCLLAGKVLFTSDPCGALDNHAGRTTWEVGEETNFKTTGKIFLGKDLIAKDLIHEAEFSSQTYPERFASIGTKELVRRWMVTFCADGSASFRVDLQAVAKRAQAVRKPSSSPRAPQGPARTVNGDR